MNERWECGNCLHIGPLNIHGRCEGCDSNAVIPQTLLERVISLTDLALQQQAAALQG